MTTRQEQIGVVGAGTMGVGIAMAFASAGFTVRLVDASAEALANGARRLSSLYDEGVARGKLSADEAAIRIARIGSATNLDFLADTDLVVEAVYEDLSLKSRIASELGAICKPATILASNTSSLDINTLADASGRPDRYAGMHFFSPAHLMRLVEIARGDKTSEETVSTIVELAHALSKVPVVCGVCFGFIGNRMAEPYLREADALILEGATPAQIDAVAESPAWIGMAMGPCRMMDLAGLDVGASIVAERAAGSDLLADASYRAVMRALAAEGHLGQKTGRGFYRYEGRKPLEEPHTAALAGELSRELGVATRTDIADQEIFERLLYPMINEGYDVLLEHIAASPEDIDTVFTAGFGFPSARGGPMAMARTIGLATIAGRLDALAQERGNPFGYWTVSPLLRARCEAESSHTDL